MERLLLEFANGMLLYDRFCWVNKGATGGGNSSEYEEGREEMEFRNLREQVFFLNFRNYESFFSKLPQRRRTYSFAAGTSKLIMVLLFGHNCVFTFT
jgi:hypothetical protein